jgi:hypothetical protein
LPDKENGLDGSRVPGTILEQQISVLETAFNGVLHDLVISVVLALVVERV